MNEVQRPAEQVAIVDENNKRVGSSTRGQMRAENLIHRCSFVAIFNSQVQLRLAAEEPHAASFVNNLSLLVSG